MRLLDKKRERERARAEFTEDVTFKTTIGLFYCLSIIKKFKGVYSVCVCVCVCVCTCLYNILLVSVVELYLPYLNPLLLAGKNVYRTLFLTKLPEKNELFAPRRMVSLCSVLTVCKEIILRCVYAWFHQGRVHTGKLPQELVRFSI